MFAFVSEELVWAMTREREEEARRVHPHTERKPDPERHTHDTKGHSTLGLWFDAHLRPNLNGSH
jgi:hypothetical protein